MYLDPGFGGMLLQVLIAIAAVGGATLFALRKNIKAFFSRKNKDEMKGNATKNLKNDQEVEDIIDTLEDKD